MSIEYQRNNNLYPEMCNIDTIQWAEDVFADPERRKNLGINTIKLHRAILRHGLQIDEVSIETRTLEWEERYLEKEVPDPKRDSEAFRSYACAFYQFAHHPTEWDALEEYVELNANDAYEYVPKDEQERNHMIKELKDGVDPAAIYQNSLNETELNLSLSALD